jgi:hypothetical protein
MQQQVLTLAFVKGSKLQEEASNLASQLFLEAFQEKVQGSLRD